MISPTDSSGVMTVTRMMGSINRGSHCGSPMLMAMDEAMRNAVSLLSTSWYWAFTSSMRRRSMGLLIRGPSVSAFSAPSRMGSQ